MPNSIRKHRPVNLTLQGLVDLGRLDEASARLIRRREHSLLSLLELTNELSVSLDPYEIADLLLFNLMGHLGTPRSSLWLLPQDRESTAIVLRAYGITAEKAEQIGRICGTGIVRLMGSREAPMETTAIAPSLESKDRELIEGSKLTLFAPVFSRSNLLGMVGLGARVSSEPYETVDKQILQCSLGALGVALENTHLYSNLAERNRQLAQAYERLKEHDRLKSEFLHNVNHELRTPLTVILASSQWLLSEEEGASKRHFLETISNEGRKLHKLLERLLDLSAITSDELEFHPEDLDLEPILEQFFLDRHLGVAAGLRELRYLAEPGLPRVRTDRLRAQQILEAFIDNAIKFTPEGSRIRIEARHVGGAASQAARWVRIDVRDNGPGIPEDQLADLFASFQQGDGSTSRPRGGLGLGLALARQMAERMGAKVDAQSTLGEGSVFSLILPVAASSDTKRSP